MGSDLWAAEGWAGSLVAPTLARPVCGFGLWVPWGVGAREFIFVVVLGGAVGVLLACGFFVGGGVWGARLGVGFFDPLSGRGLGVVQCF